MLLLLQAFKITLSSINEHFRAHFLPSNSQYFADGKAELSHLMIYASDSW